MGNLCISYYAGPMPTTGNTLKFDRHACLTQRFLH